MPIPVWNLALRDGGTLCVRPDSFQILDRDGHEVVYWDESEWNEPGNAEAARACLNAILMAMFRGGSQAIIDHLKLRREEGGTYVPRELPES
jgi:hypothetical protein